MSGAADSLRVSQGDGRLLGRPIALQGHRYEIGSDSSRQRDPEFIYLQGSGVLTRHAILRRGADAPEWFLELVGNATITMGGKLLEKGPSVPVQNARDIWVGQNHLQLIYGGGKTLGAAALGGLSDLEQSLNARLLDFEERNRDIALREDVDREQLLSDQLNTFLDETLNEVSRPLLDMYCQEALRRILIQRCLMSGASGDVPLSYSILSEDQRRMANKVRADFIARLRLEVEPEYTSADIRRIQKNMADAYRVVSPTIEVLLKRNLIVDAVRERVLGLFFKLGPIQFLLDIPGISEIMVCGHDKVYVEKGNRMFETGLQLASEEELRRVVRSISSKDEKHLTAAEPMMDARLPDGSRANIVLSPIAKTGISLTIRKFNSAAFTLEVLQERKALSNAMRRFLSACVRGRKNIIISGGTGTGKTTLLNALSREINDEERLVTVEDTAELNLQHGNLVNLEARRANSEGEGEISIQDLVRNALRMRPDRIIVGECRGGEALDMLQAMNTGHDGSMTTAHANSPADLLLRLETMIMQSDATMPIEAIRQQIAASLDVIIQVRRTPPLDGVSGQRPKVAEDGRTEEMFQRTIYEIAELGTYDPDTKEISVQPIFRLIQNARGARFDIAGYLPSFFDELQDQGLIDIQKMFEDVEAAE